MRVTKSSYPHQKRESSIRRQGSGSSSTPEPKVIFEDNHLLGVVKPAGMVIQSDQGGELSLLDWGKSWLKEKYKKPGNVFLGLVQRLDKPVSGVVIFAKTSKAASRLSESFRHHQVKKTYRAIVEGTVPDEVLNLTHYLGREGNKTLVSPDPLPDYKKASLSFRGVRRGKIGSLVEIDLETGKKHQIRAQLSHIGHPILGDSLYGAKKEFEGPGIALVAKYLEIPHPVSRHENVILRLEDSEDPLLLGWK